MPVNKEEKAKIIEETRKLGEQIIASFSLGSENGRRLTAMEGLRIVRSMLGLGCVVVDAFIEDEK